MNGIKSCIIYSLISAAIVSGNGAVSITQFLSQTQQRSITAAEHNSASPRASFSGIPFVNDLEFRVRNTGFNADDFRYTLKVEPEGYSKRKAEDKYISNILTTYQLKKKINANRLLQQNYDLVLDITEKQKLLSLCLDLKLIYEDKIKVFKSKMNEAGFDLSEIIEAEKELTKLQSQILNLQKGIHLLQSTCRTLLHDSTFITFDTTNLITVNTIIQNMQSLYSDPDSDNIHLKYFQAQCAIPMSQFELERAQSRQFISSIELSYDNGTMYDELVQRNKNKDYNLDNAWILELGIKIPFLTGSRNDLAKREIAYLKEYDQFTDSKNQFSEQLKKDFEDIQEMNAQYLFLLARETEINAEASLKKYLEMPDVDPLSLLSIKETIIRNQMNITIERFGIYRNYIQILESTGHLLNNPAENVLSEKRELFQK